MIQLCCEYFKIFFSCKLSTLHLCLCLFCPVTVCPSVCILVCQSLLFLTVLFYSAFYMSSCLSVSSVFDCSAFCLSFCPSVSSLFDCTVLLSVCLSVRQYHLFLTVLFCSVFLSVSIFCF